MGGGGSDNVFKNNLRGGPNNKLGPRFNFGISWKILIYLFSIVVFLFQICATVTLVGGCCAYLLIASNSLAKFIAKVGTR